MYLVGKNGYTINTDRFEQIRVYIDEYRHIFSVVLCNTQAEQSNSYYQSGMPFGRIVMTTVAKCDTEEEAVRICKTIQYYMVTGELNYLRLDDLENMTPKELF